MSMIDKITTALEEAALGYSMNLIRLVDGVSTYRLAYSDGEVLEFDNTDDLYLHVAAKKRRVQAHAVIEALREPTTNMVLKGLVRSERDDIDLTLEEVEEIWRAMIDDALATN
ncbi:hypothetical protein [Shinella sp. M31]|uniref:hypothetical protein n=1 Tax=Shinella sp. M31 TaxID=3368615 RepID=UPI003B9DD276